MTLAEVADEHGLRIEVIDWDIEKSLDLWGMEVHGENPIDSGGG